MLSNWNWFYSHAIFRELILKLSGQETESRRGFSLYFSIQVLRALKSSVETSSWHKEIKHFLFATLSPETKQYNSWIQTEKKMTSLPLSITKMFMASAPSSVRLLALKIRNRWPHCITNGGEHYHGSEQVIKHNLSSFNVKNSRYNSERFNHFSKSTNNCTLWPSLFPNEIK